MSTEEYRWSKIELFLKSNSTISNANVRKMFGVSPATANRILAGMVAAGKVQKIRVGRSWGYVPCVSCT